MYNDSYRILHQLYDGRNKDALFNFDSILEYTCTHKNRIYIYICMYMYNV